MTPLLAGMWTLALIFLQILCVSMTESARPGAADDLVSQTACVVLATSLVIFAMVRLHAREVSLRTTLGVAPVAPLHLILSIAAGAGLYPLLSTADDWVVHRWPYSPEEQQSLEHLFTAPTLASRVVLVLAAFVALPLARELFFRGIVFGEVLRTRGVGVAMVVSAVFFTASNFEWRTIPTTLMLGLALARLRDRTGTVLASAAAHLAFYAVPSVLLLKGWDMNTDFVFATRWIVGGAVIALLALVAVGAGRGEEEE
jgi:hypothetical protein